MLKEEIIMRGKQLGFPRLSKKSHDNQVTMIATIVQEAIKAERERIIALNAPDIEKCNVYIANLEKELQFTQKRVSDLEMSICQREFIEAIESRGNKT